MKLLKRVFLSIFFCSCFHFVFAEEINLLDGIFAWQRSYGLEFVELKNSFLTVKSNADYGHTAQIKTNYEAEKFSFLQMQIEALEEFDGKIAIFFASEENPKLINRMSVSQSCKLAAGENKIVNFDLSKNAFYKGKIIILRLDIAEKAGKTLKFKLLTLADSAYIGELIKLPELTINQENSTLKNEVAFLNFQGATGHLHVEGSSIFVEKTNALGQLIVQMPVNMSIKKGLKYWIECEYFTENALVSSILLLRGSLPGQPLPGKLSKDIFGSKWLWGTYTSIRNLPAGKYDKRYGTFEAENDAESVLVNLVIWGNPFSLKIDNIRVHPEPWPEVRPGKIEKYENRYSIEEVNGILAKRPELKAVLGSKNGRKTILVNDDIDGGFPIYKGLSGKNNRGKDFANFADIGIQKQIISIATGKKTLDDADAFWTEIGEYDFAAIDNAVYEVLQKNPNAEILFNFTIRPCLFWSTKRPISELGVNYKGERVYGPGLYGTFTSDYSIVDTEGSGKFWMPSWSSEIFRTDCMDMLKAASEHIRKQPYGKVVIGTTFSGGDDGQFGSAFYDQSIAAKKFFADFLLKKYKSIDLLNKVWKSNYTSFEEINPPEKRVENWALSHRLVGLESDYVSSKLTATYNFRDSLAAAFKEGMQKEVVAFAYGFPSGSYFSEQKHLDAQCFQPGYFQRRAGIPSINFPRTLHHRKDLAYITEFDTRGQPDPHLNLFYADGVGRAENQSEWNQAHRKLMGNILANGYLCWFYDMNQFYNTSAYRQEIKQVQNVVKKLFERLKTKFNVDVCAVLGDRQSEFTNHWMLLTNHINYNPQQQEYAVSGVPMHKVTLSEIRKYPELQNYKVYIFFQNAYFSDAERQFINRELKKDGRVIIWVYDPGFISDRGMNDAEFSQLIGMQVESSEKPGKPFAIYDKSAPFMNNVPDMCNGLNYLSVVFPDWPGWKNFRITEENITVMAKYAEDGSVAGAMKKFADWTSIYLANPHSLHGSLLRNIAEGNDCYVAGDYGQELSIDGDFASVHGIIKNDNYTLNLPAGKKKIYDAFTGLLLAENIEKYTFQVEPWQTYWFFME